MSACTDLSQLMSETKYTLKRQLVCSNVCQMQEAGHVMALMRNSINLLRTFLHQSSHLLSSLHLGMLIVSEAAKIK